MEIQRYLERRILVNFAGAIAETLTPGPTPERGVDEALADKILKGETAVSDFAKVRESVVILRNIMHPDILDPSEAEEQKCAIHDRLWDRAVQLVEQFEELIVNAACGLVQHVKRDGVSRIYSATYTEEVLEDIPNLQLIPLLEP